MAYFTRRLVHATLLLIGISFFSFGLFQLAPGDFVDEMRMDPRISRETIESLRSGYGLDRPFPIRYGLWLRAVLDGQLGFSLAYNSPVGPLLRVRARNTLLLTGTATLLAWLFAIPVGIWAAANRGKWSSFACGFATSALLSVPDLLLFLCLLLFAVRTGWFPAGGMVSPGLGDVGFGAKAKDVAFHFILPSLGLALAVLPPLIRHVRSAMVEVLDSPFIRAARGHGIPRARILFRFALPVAANPLLSLLGLSVAMLLSTSLLAELVLGWPGLGPLLVEATLARDTYVVVDTVMLSAVLLLAGNLLSDILLFAADPRIRRD